MVFHICFRVNPTATLEIKQETPVEIALSRNSTQVLNILSEYTDVSVTVKLVQLSKLMYSSDNVEKSKEEFQGLLHSLPLDLVSSAHSNFIKFVNFSQFKTAHFHLQVSSKTVRNWGTLLKDAVCEEKKDFVRILLEYGFVSAVFIILVLTRLFCFRVDPTAVSDRGDPSPMELAVLCHPEMLKILTGFKEIPDDLKPAQLTMLMSGAKDGGDVEKVKEEFQEILSSLSSSVEMVRHLNIILST